MNKTLINSNQASSMRLDKWLWCARFFKSRQLAVTAIKSHNISVNGSKAKPSRLISTGDYLIIDKNRIVYEIKITGLSAQRLSAPLAAQLYQETEQSIDKRQRQSELRKQERLSRVHAPRHKPDKRNRRERARLKRGVE